MKRASRASVSSSPSIPVSCIVCRSRDLRRFDAEVPVRGRTPSGKPVATSAVVGMLKCRACGERFEEPGSWVARDAAMHRALGLLSADDILRARTERGWSRRELAERTGIGTASIYRWERGQKLQSRANDRLLRLAFGLGGPSAGERGRRSRIA